MSRSVSAHHPGQPRSQGRTSDSCEPVAVCTLARVPRGGGVAALVHGRQVAVFRTDDDRLFALDNRDPFTGANVLARGIVGAHGDVPTVASPLRKQRFDLSTGACLDDDEVVVAVHAVDVVDDRVVVALGAAGDGPNDLPVPERPSEAA